MKKIVLIIQLLLPLLSMKSLSQGKVSGSVFEEKNIPASFATISIVSSKDSLNVKALFSQENGKYNFDNVGDGEYLIAITYVGFERTFSQKFIISSETPKIEIEDIILKKSVVMLNEVVVRSQKKIIERLPDRFVMNLSSTSFASNNLYDLFRATPFMTVQGKSISFKGKPNLLVLVDNRPIPQESLSNYLESTTGSEIEKIEFITAPSSRYDATVDGVISITTKRGLKLGLTGSIRGNFSQGIYENGNTGINLTYRKEKYTAFAKYGYVAGSQLNEQVGYRAFSLENGKSFVYNTLINMVSKYRIQTPQIGVDLYLHKKHTLGLLADFSIVNPPLGKLDSYTYFSSKIGGKDSTLIGLNAIFYKSNSVNYSMNYRGILDSLGKEVNVIVTNTLINGEFNNQLDEQTITDNNDKVLQRFAPLRTSNPYAYKIFIGQADFLLPFKNSWKVDVGFKITSSKSETKTLQDILLENTWKEVSANSFTNSLSEQITSLYANTAKSIKKSFFQVGLRAENTVASAKNAFDYNYTNLFPSILFQQNFSDNYQLTVNYREKIIRPSYSQVLPYSITIDRYTINEGNITLQPQYSKVLTITNSIKNNTYITFDYSRNKGEVLELPTQKGNVTTWKPINVNLSETISANIYQTLNVKPWWQFNNYLWGAHYDANSNVNNQNIKVSGFGWSFATSSTFSLPKEYKVDIYYSYDSPYLYGLFTTPERNYGRIAFRKTAWDKKAEFTLAFEDIFRGTYYGGYLQLENFQNSMRSYQDTRRFSFGFTYQFGKKTVAAAQEKSMGNEEIKQRASTKR